FLVAAPDGGLILLQLLLQFRNFQHGEKLSLLYVGSIVDIEFLDVAGNLCVDVHFLKGLEFGSDLQVIRNVSSRHLHDGGGGSVRRIVGSRLVSLAASDESRGKNQKDKKNQEIV